MLAVFRRHIRDGLTNGNPQARKASLRTLVAEIVVDSRNKIRPFFKVPTLTSGVSKRCCATCPWRDRIPTFSSALTT